MTANEKSGDDGNELKRRRAAIDALDRDLLRIVSERAAHAQAIGLLKSGPAYRPEREAEVLRRVVEMNKGPLSHDAVAGMFREIMSACLALEQQLSVAYLGPPGTYSHTAVTRHFGESVAAEPCASIDEVFRAAEAGRADYAVVPVENSTEGAVGRTLDLMAQTPLIIVGEIKLRIRQNLLGRNLKLGQVKRVYSHAQSLAQCVQWLAQHLPAAERVAVASNAEAARLAAAEPSTAAVAGEAAAAIYGLDVISAHIEDEPNNTTRFWVLGRHAAGPSGKDETSLVMSAKNQPGAVYALLEPFAKHGVSMSRLESRPARTGLWEYLFFVDLEGHQTEPAVAAALAELKSRAPFLKLLGSYPAALA
ncbi:MAG TPA: prephenate dehydratase [Casimicrobiaceae bacterium]|nr:prephenate dehydratase [Casimicrobiaceae bacterium]